MPIEYCLFFSDRLCMPSSDWAAWVEAVGVVVSLAVAVAVPYYFHRVEAARARKSAGVVEKVTLARLERVVAALLDQAPSVQRACASFPNKMGLRTARHLAIGNTEYLRAEQPNLHLLGEQIALPVAELFAAIVEHNSRLETNAAILEGDFNDPESFSCAFGQGSIDAIRDSSRTVEVAADRVRRAMEVAR